MTTDSPSDQIGLVDAARTAAGGQQYPKAALYVVATPIGNLADLSLRAIHVLALVDAVACEDTRVGASLLRHLGLDKPRVAVHAHNESEAASLVIARLAQGERLAFVSDAGTPAVSDPGARLVRMVADAGYRVIPIPGASSVATALSVAGDDSGDAHFEFHGFVPARGSERSAAIEAAATRSHTVVLFEGPHRIESLAAALAEACAQRRVTVCRELTKQFETVAAMPASDLPAWLQADPNRTRGEFVVVLHALRTESASASRGETDASADRLLKALLAELPLKQAVGIAASATGAPRNALYARALELKRED